MSNPLTQEDVAKVAKLSRLKLSENELAAITQQMGSILEYVDVLNEVDTEDIEPMAHTIEMTNVFREDEIQDSLPREAALSNAPKSDGKYFCVPPILDGA